MSTATSAARSAVLRQLALAHDAWAAQEQLLARAGKPVDAEGARVMAQRVIRAWLAERDDPKPEGLP